MPTERIRMIDVGDISAGSFAEYSQAEEIDLTLKRVFVVEKGGGSLAEVTMTLYVGDKPVLYPDAVAEIFNVTNQMNPEFSIPVAKGVRVNGKVTNNGTASKHIYLILVYEK